MMTPTARNRMVFGQASEWLEWADAAFTDHRFSPHRHDSYALGYTTYGIQLFDYRGRTWASRPGDVFVLYPDELHDGRTGSERGFGYRIVYIAPQALLAASGGTRLPFVDGPVVRSGPVNRAIRAAFRERDSAFDDDLSEASALAMFADALRTAETSPSPGRGRMRIAAMQRIREQLAAANPHAPTMADLERVHGIDRFSLAREFRRAFGVSPHRFLVLRRLDHARRAIAAGMPLAEAAAEAGFADQSHLTRHFRAAFGLTPGQWRRMSG